MSEWMRSFVCCMLTVSVATRLVPEKKYGIYVRMFTGCLLVLMFLQPFFLILSPDNAFEEKLRQFLEEQQEREEQMVDGGFLPGQPVEQVVIDGVKVEVSADD